MTFRPLHPFAALLLTLAAVAAPAPQRPRKNATHAAKSRSSSKPSRPSITSRKAVTGTPKSRFATRRLVHVDPVSRLDTISTIATALSRGASAISYPAALSRFYAALAAHQEDPSAATLRVLQFGDSHTAADMFTGETRRVLQRQFGNGSVGFTYAGHPFAGYRILGSQRTQSGGWQTLGTHFSNLGDAMLGMGGVGVTTSRPGEYITLDAPCTALQLDYLQQPGGGALKLTDNGVEVASITTDSPGFSPGNLRYTCPDAPNQPDPEPDHHFVLTTQSNAPVRLFGLTALQPGVTWESIGINGAEAPLLLRWDQALFTPYLRDSAASLVVLAYGTNEAAARMDPDTYAATFARIVDNLHAAVPDAAVLVLGPADRATAARRRGYAPFAGTEPILDAQRTVCRTHDCAFWDEQRRMGGLGSMQRWVYAGWAQHDHTHLTGEGYRALADALMADLLSGYDSYRKAHGLPLGNTLDHTTATGTPRSSSIPSTSTAAGKAN